MSSTIWTQCAERFKPRAFSVRVLRGVEDQQVNATRRLVDSDDEQAVLERLIDESAKPPWPPDPRLKRLHPLLATPFRYPPLRFGSRFGARHERGIFYATETMATLHAEKAFYVLLFLAGTSAPLGTLTRTLTVFRAALAVRRGAELTRPPFARFDAELTSKVSYADTQPLGKALRAAGVEGCRYRSARDPAGGANFALFEPLFQGKHPLGAESWVCTATPALVEFKPGLLSSGQRRSFTRADFEVDGVLPTAGCAF